MFYFDLNNIATTSCTLYRIYVTNKKFILKMIRNSGYTKGICIAEIDRKNEKTAAYKK